MDKTGDGLNFLKTKFPRLSEAKIKEGIFVGPQIIQLFKDSTLMKHLNRKGKRAWLAFKNANLLSEYWWSLVRKTSTSWGSPFIGEYGCPNPEVPRDLYSLPVYPPLCLLLSADPFHPSTASEGALHEKLLPLCLLLASHGQPKPPLVGRTWRPFRRVVHCWSPV
ncbi:hypothetical protein AVEN_154481-1 [Araneus ventricosus]|uniref:Uncharacterized protein n=1 Tax=Araneus ventricosus TaxID=182803 RepID=A0A4Y2RAT0_ARAVE|nr:hypothetical protein AVEN_154481-1 [Araneus ventricosus]